MAMRIIGLLMVVVLAHWALACDDGGGSTVDAGQDAYDGMDDGDGYADGGDEVPDGGDEVPDGGDEVPDGGDNMPDGGDDVADGGDELPDGGDIVCVLDYDCPTGQVCRQGYCEPFTPECSVDQDCPGDQVCLGERCLDQGNSPYMGALVFNEILSDGDTDGDPNGDGSRDAVEDEFVELVNVSNETLDLSGFVLVESNWDIHLPRQTFPNGTLLLPMQAVVVFGGGEPPQSNATALYFASNAQDPGTAYGLDLDDSGETIRLLDSAGLLVAVFSYGDSGDAPATFDESLTRSPDLSGDFQSHSQAAGSPELIFSPGTRLDGTPF